MKQQPEQLALTIGAIFIGLLVSMLLAFPVKWLWNWLVPEIFGLLEISAVQAWGLIVLLQLLGPKTKLNPEL